MVLQKVFDLCHSLKRLTVSSMYRLPNTTRMQLAQQVAGLLASSTELTLVDLSEFSTNKDEGEGQVMLEALSNSPCLDKITQLNIGGNSSWWKDNDYNTTLLCETILRMKSLKYFSMYNSQITTEQ